jgi:hypothetical protein
MQAMMRDLFGKFSSRRELAPRAAAVIFVRTPSLVSLSL